MIREGEQGSGCQGSSVQTLTLVRCTSWEGWKRLMDSTLLSQEPFLLLSNRHSACYLK
jgi:hypothetical protein